MTKNPDKVNFMSFKCAKNNHLTTISDKEKAKLTFFTIGFMFVNIQPFFQ